MKYRVIKSFLDKNTRKPYNADYIYETGDEARAKELIAGGYIIPLENAKKTANEATNKTTNENAAETNASESNTENNAAESAATESAAESDEAKKKTAKK